MEAAKISKIFVPLFLIMLLICDAYSNGNISSNNQTAPDIPASEETLKQNERERTAETADSTAPQLYIDEESDAKVQIRLSFENQEVLVNLEDNPTTKDLLSQLPLTLTFEDFNEIKKICRIPEKLSNEGMPDGVDPDIGDITLYVPWNTLVFYYEEFSYHKDLIPIGHVESGLDALAGMADDFLVTIEKVESSESSLKQILTLEDNGEETNIIITVGNTVITATLNSSAIVQEFLQTLPRSMTMNRWGDREYYGRLDAGLSMDGEQIDDFSDGDITFYPAGPSFAIFFANMEKSSLSGLIRMGRVTSDLSAFEALGNTVEMQIEIAP